jgi:hypothetical protein
MGSSARAVHVAFYVLLFALPLSGWALATVDGQPLSFFGLFDLPRLRIGAQLPITGGTLSEDQLEAVHELLFNVLLGLALIHIAAALKHHLWDHDAVREHWAEGKSKPTAQMDAVVRRHWSCQAYAIFAPRPGVTYRSPHEVLSASSSLIPPGTCPRLNMRLNTS